MADAIAEGLLFMSQARRRPATAKQKAWGCGILLLVVLGIGACVALVNRSNPYSASNPPLVFGNSELRQAVQDSRADVKIQDPSARKDALTKDGLELQLACQKVLASPDINVKSDVQYCQSLQRSQ